MSAIRTVGVIGAGTIGRGVAQQLAERGVEVRLVDTSRAQLESALAEIQQDLRYFALYRSEGGPQEGFGVILSRIRTGTELDALGDVDFVIENVTEDWDVKRAVYKAIDPICRPDVVFGANTSAIAISRLAALMTRPEQVIGLHFMNPVPLIGMVEVIRGHETSDVTLRQSTDLLSDLGKVGVVVQDAPGFVTNRVMMPMINEAVWCVQDGVASPAQVDDIFRGCFGHKMGPLETADLIGLDTILNSIIGMFESFKDGKYRPAPRLKAMVDAGMLGRKSGQGFYVY